MIKTASWRLSTTIGEAYQHLRFMKYILALDQGTTGTSAIIFDSSFKAVSKAYQEFPQIYPKPGWVEHNPLDILKSVQATISKTLSRSPAINKKDIAAIGITNQRETSVIWNRRTGAPVHNAIVWQCRRTAQLCASLKRAGCGVLVKKKTGLVIDAYFSATKIMWFLENIKGLRRAAAGGDYAFGTIDSWLLWNLTGGSSHATDFTNASRTMIFNIDTLKWDNDLLSKFHIPKALLPKALPSGSIFGYTKNYRILPDGIPISGIAGDQQAALFAHGCFSEERVKNTYGTGCFLMMNTKRKRINSRFGLLTTLACDEKGSASYALEGSVFIAGALIQWLRDGLHLIGKASETEALAKKVPDTAGVYIVPAFAGLGAPYWDSQARGLICGITRAARREHLIRASLEAIAYESNDVIESMRSDAKRKIKEIHVDGKAAENNFLMQFQSDISGAAIVRPSMVDMTAKGAGLLAALTTGVIKNASAIHKKERYTTFTPRMKKDKRDALCDGWKKAVGMLVGTMVPTFGIDTSLTR